jgi:hypothetical protein
MFLYRGDSRSPATIKAGGGFKAWVPLTAQQAQNLVLKFCGSTAQLQLPPQVAATVARRAKEAPFGLDPGDLARLIISTKSRDTAHVSTAMDEDCGGYASLGYVYKMEFQVLMIVAITNAVLGQNLLKKSLPLWPELALSGARLNMSGVVAVKQRGAARELSFLTPIPLANIVAYKKSGPAPFIPFHR